MTTTHKLDAAPTHSPEGHRPSTRKVTEEPPPTPQLYRALHATVSWFVVTRWSLCVVGKEMRW